MRSSNAAGQGRLIYGRIMFQVVWTPPARVDAAEKRQSCFLQGSSESTALLESASLGGGKKNVGRMQFWGTSAGAAMAINHALSALISVREIAQIGGHKSRSDDKHTSSPFVGPRRIYALIVLKNIRQNDG